MSDLNVTTTDAFAARELNANRPGLDLSPWVERALVKHFGRAESDYDSGRLHYGADLECCPRKTWYRLRGTPKEPLSLGTLIRFRGGIAWEHEVISALEGLGDTVKRQVVVKPFRPSAWAWVGHADAVAVERRHLYEVKAPRARSFRIAGTRGDALVKDSYRWQASAYFHELKRVGLVDTASFLFLDREGSNAPVEVPLEGELLISLDRVVEREIERAKLIDAPDPPERVARELSVEVLKGKKRKVPERVVRASMERSWQCGYCPYENVCQPGPESTPVDLSPEDRAARIAEAEARWAVEDAAKKAAATDDEDGPPEIPRAVLEWSPEARAGDVVAISATVEVVKAAVASDPAGEIATVPASAIIAPPFMVAPSAQSSPPEAPPPEPQPGPAAGSSTPAEPCKRHSFKGGETCRRCGFRPEPRTRAPATPKGESHPAVTEALGSIERQTEEDAPW